MKKEFIFVGTFILVVLVLVGIGIVSITGNVVDADSGHDHSSHSGHEGFVEEFFENEDVTTENVGHDHSKH
jgi:hypothetical protein